MKLFLQLSAKGRDETMLSERRSRSLKENIKGVIIWYNEIVGEQDWIKMCFESTRITIKNNLKI